jgi:hypothetical protein
VGFVAVLLIVFSPYASGFEAGLASFSTADPAFLVNRMRDGEIDNSSECFDAGWLAVAPTVNVK